MKNSTRHFLIFAALLFSFQIAAAGTFYSFKAGDFTDRTNWSTTSSGAQVIPTAGAWGSNSGWDNVLTIRHAMTLPAGSYTQWGNTTSVTINSGGSLKRTGTLSLTGSGVSIIVKNGGSFETTGFLTLDGAIFSFESGSTNPIGGFSLSSSSSSSFVNAGTVTVTGSVDVSGTVTNSGTMTVTGSFVKQNTSPAVTNSGTLTVQTNVSALGLIQLNPAAAASSTMTVNGSLTVNDNPWIVVGTNVSSCGTVITNYANLIVKGSVSLTGAGDITVNQTGRLVVFGNITKAPASTGNVITIECGGQAYVNGNIDVGSGGGGTVQNNNGASSPTGSNGSPTIGLYVNGTTTAQHTGGSYGTVGTKSDLQANDNTFFNYIASIPGSPLPITLTDFYSSLGSNSVILKWSTATELNFDYFSVQKSADGKSFYEIAQVKGHGTTNQSNNYEHEDQTPFIGKNYYRLTSVDFDNYQETFGVIVQNYSAEKDFHVSPNPSDGKKLTLNLNFDGSEGRVVIYDNMGYVVDSFLVNETSELSFRNSLKEGIYVAKYTSPSFTKAVRFLVRY